jgi:hypothetical protein
VGERGRQQRRPLADHQKASTISSSALGLATQAPPAAVHVY